MELVLDAETKQQIKNMGTGWEEMKTRVATMETESKGFLKREDPLLKESIDKWADEVSKFHASLTAIKSAQEALETKLNRPELLFTDKTVMEEDAKRRRDGHEWSKFHQLRKNASFDESKVNHEEYAAFEKSWGTYLRRGNEPGWLTPEESKALSVGQDPDGGFLARPQWSAAIVKRIYESSPMRAICSVETISSGELKTPVDVNEADAGWVGETAARTETKTPQLTERTITAHELYALAKATQTVLEDAAIDLETWLTAKIGDKFARLEASAFVSGNGVSKPRGFLSYPDSITTPNDGNNVWGKLGVVKSVSSGLFTVTGLTKLVASLKDNYHARARFLIKRESIPSIMTLKDDAGRYIFQPIFSDGFNNVPLLGYQLTYAFDMPVVAANAYAAAFGDFAAGYTIVDRIGITTLRDPYAYKPYIGFYTRKRVGGDVMDFDAIKLFQLAA